MTGTVGVPSLSRRGKSWKVRPVFDGSLTCACPAHGFSKGRPKRCKHTDLVRAAERLRDRCELAAHVPAHGAVVCFQCLVELLAVSAAKVKREFKRKPVRRRREPKATPRDEMPDREEWGR